MKKALLVSLLTLIGLNVFAILPAAPDNGYLIIPEAARSFSQNFIYFAFTFSLSFIGSYLIYGILVGPAALLGVYILTKEKQKRTYAWIGFVLGTLLGITLKILALSA